MDDLLIKNVRVLFRDGSILYGSRLNRIYISSNQGESWSYHCKIDLPIVFVILGKIRLLERLFRLEVYKLHVSANCIVAISRGGVYSGKKCEKVLRRTWVQNKGSRPISLAITLKERILIGEYHSNVDRGAINIHESCDGSNWRIAYTFPPGSIRHIHGIYFDRYRDNLWIFTGDYGDEAAIYKASLDFSRVERVRGGSQDFRVYSCIPSKNGIFYGTDTEIAQNALFYLSADGLIHQKLQHVEGSVFHSCEVGNSYFFATVCEPSSNNDTKKVHIWRCDESGSCTKLMSFEKDIYPSVLQYGNVFFPEGWSDNNELLFLSGSSLSGLDGHTLRVNLND